MQKRLTRKLDLEMLLSRIEPHPAPSPRLEQYTISPDVAATMLYTAAYANDDIVDRAVLDLGCGTGRLALGAAFLGAKEVVGVDMDKAAVNVAFRNSVRTDLKEKVQWVVADIEAVRGGFDTVLQNPPFGVQKRGADRKFLAKALELGKVVYSLHKSVYRDETLKGRLKKGRAGAVRVLPSSFLERFIGAHGGRVRDVYAMPMTIPHMFRFHTKKRHVFMVDLYVIEKG
jgi:putative methylase